MQINGGSPTELRGGLTIQIDSEFVDEIQVGDEFVIMTCSQGCTRFFDEVAVSVPDPSDIYFQAFYQGNQVMIRALNAPPPPDDGIVGLQAVHNGPVFEGQPALFSAAVSAGSNVYYLWNFGDGATGHGSHVEHSYAAPGVYTATVSAANPASSASFSLPVTIWERPNFAGQVWHDADGDGRIGPGEMGLAGATVTAVGSGGNLADSSDGDGRYRIQTMTAGWYELDVALSGYQPTTAAPLSVPLPQAGSALTDFGLIEAAPPGQGRIVGRAWADADGDGVPDPNETTFAGLTVTLWQNGAQIATTTTGSSGLYASDNLAPGSYEIRAAAPSGYFPELLIVENVAVSANQISSVLLGYLAGGTIGGSVTNFDGQGMANVVLQLEQPPGTPISNTLTAGDGGYQFGPLQPGAYTLRLLPPLTFFPEDGILERQVNVGSGFYPQDWTLFFPGRLTVRAQHSYFQPNVGLFEQPLGGVEFVITHESGSSEIHATGPDGLIRLNELTAGLYTVTPVLTTIPPEASVNPAERTAYIANNTAAAANFNVVPDQSIRAICIRGLLNNALHRFDCTIEARVLADDQGTPPGALVYTAEGRGYHAILGLTAGSYEIRLIPHEANWPVYQENVTLNAGTTAVVNYPYNPQPNVTDIRGYAFLDANANGVRQCTLGECNDPSANGLTIHLYDEDFDLLSTTETAQTSSSISGFFRFQNLAAGTYHVAIDLPSGYFRTTDEIQTRLVTLQVGVDEVHFGYRTFGDASISGRVYLDLDGDGRYDADIDTPLGGLTLALETPDGEPLATTTSSPSGGYAFNNLASGQYRLILAQPPSGYTGSLEQTVSVPFGNINVTANFPLLPNDQQPRVLVFLDGNSNGQPDANEQRLTGATVSLYDAPCAAAETPVATAVTNGSGLVTFPPIMNNAVGCARVSQLPHGLAPFQANGVPVLRSGIPAWLPVQTLGSLTVQVYHDNNGNGVWDAGEPFLSGFAVAVNGAQLTTGPNGAVFNLGEGAYVVNLTPAAGYQLMMGMPQTVVVTQGGAAALRVPAQIAGGIHGRVRTSGTAGGWPGVTVELRNLNTNETRLAITSAAGCQSGACWTAGNYSFQNVTPGPYRLSLLNIPPGYLPGEEPVINYNAGQTVQQNLVIYPAGAVNGLVYHDDNYNGVQNSGEQGTAEYSLLLLSDDGQPPQTIQPAANGSFNLTGLQAGVRYALTLDPASADGGLGTAVTETPGWFTLSSQPLDLRVGLYAVPTIDEQFTKNRYNGLVYTGPWYNRTPVAGARIIAYLWQESFPAAEGCDQSNPGVLAEAFSDGDGRYHLFAPLFPQRHYCLAVVDTPGVTQPNAVIVKAYGGWPTSGGGYHYQPRVEQRDIQLAVNSSQLAVGV